jgi:NADH-dependent peroxiredoxin subunit C
MCEWERTYLESVSIDSSAPRFNLKAYNPIIDDEENVSLDDFNWKWSVLFFYPADFTFVCPTELKDMAEAKREFDSLWVTVLAISTDTQFSHRAWVKHEKLMEGFPYLMLSDHSLEVADMYWVLDFKTWISARWTFIIDPDGICRWIEITSGPLGRNSDELIRKIKALQYMRENPGTACPAKWIFWAKTLKPSMKIAWEVSEALNS